MFSPRDRDLPRGWPGRIDGDRVVQLAAQTLQSYFTGGGEAREHDVFALDDVVLRSPVQQPPNVRIFGNDGDFVFANAAAIYGPDDAVPLPAGVEQVESDLRIAAVIGASGAIGGFTLMNDWVAPELVGAKSRDFAISLGPVIVTPDEFPSRDDWAALVEHAAQNTRLLPGAILAAGSMRDGPFGAGDVVEVSLEEIGLLRNTLVSPE
jgi:2-keto-4-pentenoate hydratase/2-oxohepta-3-ene-1,7-dioic acid hydratase in catechol pathway